MNPTTPWCDILAGLRGRRLAIYDDMLRFGAHQLDWEARRVDDCEAVEWLAQHHFVWWDAADCFWRCRDARRAREMFEKQGPCTVIKPTREREPSAVPEAPSVPVHAYQVEVFALDGYRS